MKPYFFALLLFVNNVGCYLKVLNDDPDNNPRMYATYPRHIVYVNDKIRYSHVIGEVEEVNGEAVCSGYWAPHHDFLRGKVALMSGGYCSHSERAETLSGSGPVAIVHKSTQPRTTVSMDLYEGSFPSKIPYVVTASEHFEEIIAKKNANTNATILFVQTDDNQLEDGFGHPLMIFLLPVFAGITSLISIIWASYKLHYFVQIRGMHLQVPQVLMIMEIAGGFGTILNLNVDYFGMTGINNYAVMRMFFSFANPISLLTTILIIYAWQKIEESVKEMKGKFVFSIPLYYWILNALVLIIDLFFSLISLTILPVAQGIFGKLKAVLYGLTSLVLGIWFLVRAGRILHLLRQNEEDKAHRKLRVFTLNAIGVGVGMILFVVGSVALGLSRSYKVGLFGLTTTAWGTRISSLFKINSFLTPSANGSSTSSNRTNETTLGSSVSSGESTELADLE